MHTSNVSSIVLERAWKHPYKGRHADALVDRIKEANKTRQIEKKAYANYILLIQSSGVGKSRTVHEAGKKLWSIPLNLRKRGKGEGTICLMANTVLCAHSHPRVHRLSYA